MWLSVYQVLLSGSVALGKRLHLSGPQDQGHRLENHSAVVKNMASGARLCGFEFWLYHLATCDLRQVVSPPVSLSFLICQVGIIHSLHFTMAKLNRANRRKSTNVTENLSQVTSRDGVSFVLRCILAAVTGTQIIVT